MLYILRHQSNGARRKCDANAQCVRATFVIKLCHILWLKAEPPYRAHAPMAHSLAEKVPQWPWKCGTVAHGEKGYK